MCIDYRALNMLWGYGQLSQNQKVDLNLCQRNCMLYHMPSAAGSASKRAHTNDINTCY